MKHAASEDLLALHQSVRSARNRFDFRQLWHERTASAGYFPSTWPQASNSCLARLSCSPHRRIKLERH
jgi:hypothetical protein